MSEGGGSDEQERETRRTREKCGRRKSTCEFNLCGSEVYIDLVKKINKIKRERKR